MTFPDFTKLLPSVENAKFPPQFWLVILWLLLVVPTISLRGAHYEEGTVIALARGALEGHWLEPSLYDIRFIERPVLLSWLLAALGSAAGHVDLWLARLVIVALYLASGRLIFALVRRHASPLAALFAAACFFVSPMLLQKVTTAEPDLLLSLLIFAAFVVWWNGEQHRNVGALRWAAVGLLLAAAGLTKGPQPLAYFFLGVGVYVLLKRRWSGVFGLMLAGAIAGGLIGLWYYAVYQPGDLGTWMSHGRLNLKLSPLNYIFDLSGFGFTLILKLLPGILLAVPAAVAAWRNSSERRNDLVLALALYALCCTLVLMFWPGTQGRYAMPMTFAIAALAGLAFDRLRSEQPALVNMSVAVLCGLTAYKLILNWLVMPLAPALFDRTRAEGRLISAAVEQHPAPLRLSSDLRFNYNVLVHVDAPKRIVKDIVAAANAPGWMIVTPAQEQQLRAARPGLRIVRHLVLPQMNGAYLVEIAAN